LNYNKKIVLHSRSGYSTELDALIEDFISAEVIYIGVVGKDASLIEDIIDEICVGDASNVYDMLTSSLPNETLAEAVEFAKELRLEFSGDVQVVEF
jgi:ABC-type thiamin/hydroxymethylpyrimidine transport system permease subunit